MLELLVHPQQVPGLTDAAAIAAKVEGLTQRGIRTSAFGLGSGFDEDLMGADAAAGESTLAKIESPKQLASLFQRAPRLSHHLRPQGEPGHPRQGWR